MTDRLTVIEREPKLVHPLLGYICGMCSDELPYGEIAEKVLEAKGYAHDLEAQLEGAVSDEAAQRFRDALDPGFVVWHDGKRLSPEDTLTQIRRGLIAAFRGQS